MSAKTFNNVDSYGRITAAKDNLTRIRRRARRADAALLADLNQRLSGT